MRSRNDRGNSRTSSNRSPASPEPLPEPLSNRSRVVFRSSAVHGHGTVSEQKKQRSFSKLTPKIASGRASGKRVEAASSSGRKTVGERPEQKSKTNTHCQSKMSRSDRKTIGNDRQAPGSESQAARGCLGTGSGAIGKRPEDDRGTSGRCPENAR